MSFQLANSLETLRNYLPSKTIGLGITALPKRNIFQSLSDYFAEKSGNKRISFVAVGEDEIKLLHFRGDSLIGTTHFSIDKLSHINITHSTSEDGLIAILNCQIEEIISTDKNGNHKTQTKEFSILPCYFGINLNKISAPKDIVWANENKAKIEEFLKEKGK